MVSRVVDRLVALPPAVQFLVLALGCLPLLPAILAYGLWFDPWPVGKSGHPAFDDLSNLWLGAKAAANDSYGALFHREQHEAALAREFGATRTNQLWSYPPTMMVLLKPLGHLPSYAWFVAIWTLTGLAAYLAALFTRLPSDQAAMAGLRPLVVAAVFLAPGTALCVNAGQTGMMTSAILFFGVLSATARPVLAGAVMGLLIAKPHLGVTLPIVLLALGAWRAFVWTGVFALAYLAASYAVLGNEPWHLYLTVTMPEHVAYLRDVTGGPDETLKMTLFQLLRSLGVGQPLASAVHAVMSVVVLGALAATLRREPNLSLRFLAVALATVLISPYLLNYELVIVALALGRIVLDPAAVQRLGAQALFAVLAIITLGHFVSIQIAMKVVNPLSLLLLAAFGWLTAGHAMAAAHAVRAQIARVRPATG